MLGYVFLASPIVLLLAAQRVAVRRGRQDTDSIAAFICAATGLVVWPTSHALALDAALHVPGLGHLLTDTLILLAFTLFFNFSSKLGLLSTGRRHALLGVALGLVALHGALWLLDNMTVPGDRTYLFYYRYYGRPVQLFLTYLVLGIAIVYIAGIYLWANLATLRLQHSTRVRAMAMCAILIAGGTVLYGLLILAQAVASAAGVDPSTVTRYTVPLMSAVAGVALVSVLALLFARDVQHYLLELVSVRRQRELLQLETERNLRVYHRIVHISTWIDERMLRVRQDYSAGDAVEFVTRECARRGISLECRRAGREAVRVITLAYENVMESPFFDEDELDERTGLIEYFVLQMEDGTFYYDHVFKIAALAVGAERLPTDITMPGDIEPWHRELAEIVALALRISYKGE